MTLDPTETSSSSSFAGDELVSAFYLSVTWVPFFSGPHLSATFSHTSISFLLLSA